MAEQSRGRDKPRRVQVVYFPKKRKGGESSRAVTQTLPEFSVPMVDAGIDTELLSEQKILKEQVALGSDEDPSRRRATPRFVKAVKAKGKSRKSSKRRKTPLDGRASSSRRLDSTEIPTLAGLGGPPAASGPLSPQQVAEMSLYGHQLFEQGRVAEARVVFEGLVGMQVKDAFPHTMLGTIYLAQGEQQRAMALFDSALELDPGDLAARVYRGEIRLNRGKLRTALEDLERAIENGLGDDPFVERAKRLVRMAHELAQKSRR